MCAWYCLWPCGWGDVDVQAYDTWQLGVRRYPGGMSIFVVQLRFKNNERRLEVRPKHREYLTTLREQGKLVTAGPFGDDTGALLVYSVASESELDAILAADPYTPEDVYDIVLRQEWKPLFPLA
jgi:uncharacterized protein YciI